MSTAIALHPRLRGVLGTLAGLAVLAAAGCGDSLGSSERYNSVVPSTVSPFTLMTINGQALPVEMRRDSTVRVVLTQGQIMLGGTVFSQRLTLVDTPPNGLGVARESTTQGTITVNGAKVHFRASDGAEWDGTASPGWIVYTIAGNSGPVTFAFKQD
ncbi:MAG TPA: hypothetical protein VGO40_12360 [Longimicrobium sp.]|nr:hypothetical protein [Longimicrobium sp.]